MQEYLMPFVHLLLEMAPYLLLGFLIAGLLHAFVPPRFYSRHLSGRGMRPVISSALMGVPLPLCSCGVIPTAMSLRRSGASRGATVSFLISTPQTGVDSILATGALMGLPFALLRPVVAFVTSIFGGALVNRFVRGEDSSNDKKDTEDNRPAGFVPRMKLALRYGFVDMMQDIGKWLTIGLIIAGLITIFVPGDFFTGLGSYPLLNMLVVLAIAIPMYVCATGSIPIAVALMMKGLSPGAALVFLMAGPATNMAAIMVLGKVLERRTTLLYIFSIVTGAIACGLAIDYILPSEWFVVSSPAMAMSHGLAPWKIVSAIMFTALLIYAMSRRHSHDHAHEHGHSCGCTTGHACAHDEAAEPASPQPRIFAVEGMHCNHCRASVENVLKGLEGVEAVEVSLPDATASISGPASDSDIIAAVESIGFGCHRPVMS